MESFHFSINGKWIGDRNGSGKITTNGLSIDVSAPKEMAGPGIGSNPEELLTSSANNCYMITLAALLSQRKIEFDHLEVTSEAQVDRIEGRLKFKQIIHIPTIFIKAGSDVSSDRLEEYAIRAEKACFISQTLRGNVEVSVVPKVVTV